MWFLLLLRVAAAFNFESTTPEAFVDYDTSSGTLAPTTDSRISRNFNPEPETLGSLQPRRFASSRYRSHRRLSLAPIVKTVNGLNKLPSYHCLHHCLQLGKSCAAFNYAREEGVCELLGAHVCNQSGIRLENSNSFTYFDVYDVPGMEEEGSIFKSPYCSKIGLCNPACAQWARMPLLDEPCMDDFECQMKVGDNAICREPIGMCKCREGYYFETHDGASKMECLKLDVDGYRIFPNLRSETKTGLYFKLIHINMDFESASNHCIEAEGGFLAETEEGETNRFLREYMRKNKVRSAYLGLSDQAQEGNWVWRHSGQKLKSSQFWKSGAPDNFNDNEHCATITNEIDFGWDDIPCDKQTKFFCQRAETN